MEFIVPLIREYRAQGDPGYSDVGIYGPWTRSIEEAIGYGARLVDVENWRSFTIEERYVKNKNQTIII